MNYFRYKLIEKSCLELSSLLDLAKKRSSKFQKSDSKLSSYSRKWFKSFMTLISFWKECLNLTISLKE
jgi:hypothetical protein